MADLTRWRDLQKLADYATAHFKLGKVTVKPITHAKTQHMGRCSADGVIEVRVHQLHRPNQPLKWTTVVKTLAHELAHLHRRRPDRASGWVLFHGVRHRKTIAKIRVFWEGHNAASALLPPA